MKTLFHCHMHSKQNIISTEEYRVLIKCTYHWLLYFITQSTLTFSVVCTWQRLWKIIAGFLLQESQISPHQQRFLHSTFGCCSLCWLYEDQQADLDICFVVSFVVRSKTGHFMTHDSASTEEDVVVNKLYCKTLRWTNHWKWPLI